MIKFKDLLEIIDLEEQKLNVIVDSNLGSLSINDYNDYLDYGDYVVGFVRADLDEIILRLYKGVLKVSKTLGHLRSELENMTFERWSLYDLNVYVSEFLGFKVEFEEMVNETLDYRLGINLVLEDETLAYVDIHYLNDRQDNMFVTEISFDGDSALNDIDYKKTIKGVQQ